jgi:hypothetical protein
VLGGEEAYSLQLLTGRLGLGLGLPNLKPTLVLVGVSLASGARRLTVNVHLGD